MVVCYTVLALLPIGSCILDLSRGYGSYFSQGDEWVYEVTSTYEYMEMSGTMWYRYDGISTEPISGHSSRMYVVRVEAYLDVSGSYGGGLLAGYSMLEATMFIDCETLYTVCYDSVETTHIDISYVTFGVYESVDYTVTNLTIYNPPGGSGAEPAYLEVGTTWTKTYTVQSEVIEVVDGTMNSYSVDYSERVDYEVLRIEPISVPAGDFECYAMRAQGPDFVQIYWVSEHVKFEVKVDYYYGTYGEMHYMLTDYRESLGGTSEGAVSYLAAGAVVSVVAAAVIVLIVTRKWPRSPTAVSVPEQAPSVLTGGAGPFRDT